MTDLTRAWDDHPGDVARAVLIREFERRLLDLFTLGELNGTVHTCIGQEFAAVAVARALGDEDFVFSNHRGHGHYLSVHPDVAGLLAEVMGRTTGVCGGVGGSQHLAGPRFLSNGIQAGLTPIAVGHAMARRRLGSSGVSVAFIGDGTLGEGLLYESLNLAAVTSAPVLFVLEDNGYAQSTDTSTTTAGSVEGRASAFGLPYFAADSWDWPALFDVAGTAVDEVRTAGRPAFLRISTYRLMAHSKGDDNRPTDEVGPYWERDPLERLRELDADRYEGLVAAARSAIDAALESARAAPAASYEPRSMVSAVPVSWRAAPVNTDRHVDLVHDGMRRAMEGDPDVVLLGEDIEGPYGGAFKVTRDLSLAFPGRVLNAPISEAAIVGCGTGLAIGGLKPTVEIMFGDFLTLAMDQLLQHASKFADMFGGAVRVPMVVRTPMGGRRGYGPTHSQSIEKHFLGIPGLSVVAPNPRIDVTSLYVDLLTATTEPTLVIENKTQYTRFGDDAVERGFDVLLSDESRPTVRISPRGVEALVTVVCYGGMLEEAELAQSELFDTYELAVEIICPTSLYPLNMTPVLESVTRTHRLIVLEEGPAFAAFGSEVVSQVVEAGITIAARRRGYSGLIPASGLRESELLVDAADIVRLVRDLLGS